jgi:hypothetical protein
VLLIEEKINGVNGVHAFLIIKNSTGTKVRSVKGTGERGACAK